MKKSLKHYAEEAHRATIRGDKVAQAKWDERGNARIATKKIKEEL